MGCDIHIRAEIRERGHWRPSGPVFRKFGAIGYDFARPAILQQLSDGALLDAFVSEPPDAPTLSVALRDVVERHQESFEQSQHLVDSQGARFNEWQALQSESWTKASHQRRRSARLTPTLRQELEQVLHGGGARARLIPLLRLPDEDPLWIEEPWEGRNYDLFAILADVRNGWGFAGVETGSGFNPISLPRGIPEDCHPDSHQFLDSFGLDGHSHSYLSSSELENYNWRQMSDFCGLVSEEEYSKIVEGQAPASWSGGVAGPGAVAMERDAYQQWTELGRPPLAEPEAFGRSFPDLSNGYTPLLSAIDCPTLDELIRAAGRPDLDTLSDIRPHIRYRWRESYLDAAGAAFQQTRQDLIAAIPAGGDGGDIRLIFFFDN